MKKCAALLLAFLCAGPCFAQKDIPVYGKIDPSELKMTTCDFDPEAEAVILLKVGESTFLLTGEGYLQTVYRFRIKILKDKGIDRANVKVGFYSRDKLEDIEAISGETYNLDASGNTVKTKLEKNSVFIKQVDKNFSELAFTLPDVKKGSVIEYKYTKLSKDYTDIDNWDFQDDIPTKYCQFYLSVPTYFDFMPHIHRTLPMEVANVDGLDAAKTYTMTNIPALRDEPFMSAPRDYLQHIEFQLSAIRVPGEPERSFRNTWTKLNDELLDDVDFGGQLHRNIPHTNALDAQLAIIKDTTARMKVVFDYVRQHMDWNGDKSRYSFDGVKSAWEKKSGNTGDINLILVNLLRDAGLKADPILVSTRDHGRINTIYPMLSQFNETLAFVRIGDKSYTLNAADKFNPSRLVPYDVQYTEGFVVDKDLPGWVTLDNDNSYKAVVILQGSMDSTGHLRGNAAISNFDYSKNLRCKNLGEGMDKFKEIYFTKAYSNLTIDSLTITDQDNDSLPLRQAVQFQSQLNNSGQYFFIDPNLFMGLEKNPFVAEHRFTDVDFGYQQSYMIVGNIDIPEGYQFESLPKNIRMIMADTSIVLERIMEVNDNAVSFRISLQFKRPVYYTDEYDDFREFYKKLFSTLNDQIVVRKKTT